MVGSDGTLSSTEDGGVLFSEREAVYTGGRSVGLGMSCASVRIGSAAVANSDLSDSRGGSGMSIVRITDFPLERVSEENHECWCDGNGWASYEVVAMTSRTKPSQKHTSRIFTSPDLPEPLSPPHTKANPTPESSH